MPDNNQIASLQINHLLNQHLRAIVNGIEVAVSDVRRPSARLFDEMIDRDITLRDLKLMFGSMQR